MRDLVALEHQDRRGPGRDGQHDQGRSRRGGRASLPTPSQAEKAEGRPRPGRSSSERSVIVAGSPRSGQPAFSGLSRSRRTLEWPSLTTRRRNSSWKATPPTGWPSPASGRSSGVAPIDSNLSTITAEADKVLRVEGPEPWLAHFELQSSHEAHLPRRLLRYNALLDDRHDLPTRSILVLLREQADGDDLSGIYRRSLPGRPSSPGIPLPGGPGLATARGVGPGGWPGNLADGPG